MVAGSGECIDARVERWELRRQMRTDDLKGEDLNQPVAASPHFTDGAIPSLIDLSAPADRFASLASFDSVAAEAEDLQVQM